MRLPIIALLSIVAAAACKPGVPNADATVNAATPADAKKFIDGVNDTTLRLSTAASQASWVSENFITDDTQALNARENQQLIDAIARYAKDAVKYDKVDVSPEIRRQLNLLKNSLTLATPSNPAEGEELTKIAAGLDAEYGKGKWCEDPKKSETCLDINKITNIMADSRDEKKLRQVWEGWQTISPPMKKDYARFVELSE